MTAARRRSRSIEVMLAGVVLSIGVHLTVGWMWTPLAGAAVGAAAARRGWLVGALAVGGGFLAATVYGFVVAPGPTQRMAETVGGFLGGVPAVVVPLVTVGLGFLLGMAGGGVGAALRAVLRAGGVGPA